MRVLKMTAATLVLAATFFTAPGCGKKAPVSTAVWTSPQYRMTANYPSDWKVKEGGSSTGGGPGGTVVVVFAKAGADGNVQEEPPMVKIEWDPSLHLLNPGPQVGPVAPGVTNSWSSMDASNLQTRSVTWPGNIPAEDASATGKPGTLFYASHNGGQLVGTADISVRAVGLKLEQGTYVIERAVFTGKDEDAKTADQIVNSVHFTQ